MRTLLAAVLMILALTGCGAEEKDKPTEKKSENAYVLAVRSEYPVLDFMSDAELIDLAKNTCILLESGYTIDDLLELTIATDIDPTMSGFLAGAGVNQYCPEMLPKIT